MNRVYTVRLTKTKDRMSHAGFTLVELLIAMTISAVIMLAIVTNYVAQSRAYRIQRERAHMQQNLRAAMYLLKNDIRNSGREPDRTGRYGIQAVTFVNPDADDPNGYPQLVLTTLMDTDGDGRAEDGANQTVVYQLMDLDGDGRRELRRQVTDPNGVVGNWDLIVDGIEDMSFAFAYDDGNGDLARFNGNANATEIWAFDSNNSNDLDTNADNNGDGIIDINDTNNGNLGTTIALNRIRAVRIWLLARSRRAFQDFVDNNTYVLAHKTINMTAPQNANRNNFRHLMLTGTVALQNYQSDS